MFSQNPYARSQSPPFRNNLLRVDFTSCLLWDDMLLFVPCFAQRWPKNHIEIFRHQIRGDPGRHAEQRQENVSSFLLSSDTSAPRLVLTLKPTSISLHTINAADDVRTSEWSMVSTFPRMIKNAASSKQRNVGGQLGPWMLLPLRHQTADY